ncbi:HVO_A0114 family putative DNA-binding protein [Hippea sp. KM1]|uniref:HVO_A0114 family putative DNA-binding protein n=1 Tax=Hippea sp. KM1 TaxID=944481 RepID=UPI00046D3821|nr:hypothetical protein [Hippea sp. KM1]
MRVKNIKIGIKSTEDSLNEFKDYWKKIEKGEEVERKEALYFESLNALRSVLTTKRIELLKAIAKHKPKSIYELSKIVNRDLKNVNEDVKLLSELGLLELKKSKTDKERTKPVIEYDRIMIEIDLDEKIA